MYFGGFLTVYFGIIACWRVGKVTRHEFEERIEERNERRLEEDLIKELVKIGRG